jgi:hypothetical protein
MLNQQLKTQTQMQQQSLQNQMNANTQRVQQGRCASSRCRIKRRDVRGMTSSGSGQQHMLPPQSNGSMLNPQN